MDSIQGVLAAMRRLHYRVYESAYKPYNLNIVGIRASYPEVDKFSCKLLVFWALPKGLWEVIEYSITTLPGRYYLIDRLLNRKGCAILAPGQYTNSYAVGLHKGTQEALIQTRPVTVYRDGNQNNKFDYLNEETGYFGLNIHGSSSGIAPKVGKYSAGCQVFQSGEEFKEFIGICKEAKKYWGNSFTYTLLEESQIWEQLKMS